jgi:hypothetical protein
VKVAAYDDDTKDNTPHWFLWTVPIKSTPYNFLNYIKSLIYYIHPTFSQIF